MPAALARRSITMTLMAAPAGVITPPAIPAIGTPSMNAQAVLVRFSPSGKSSTNWFARGRKAATTGRLLMIAEKIPATSMIARSTPAVVRPKVLMTQRIILFASGVLTRAAVIPKDAKMNQVVAFA